MEMTGITGDHRFVGTSSIWFAVSTRGSDGGGIQMDGATPSGW